MKGLRDDNSREEFYELKKKRKERLRMLNSRELRQTCQVLHLERSCPNEYSVTLEIIYIYIYSLRKQPEIDFLRREKGQNNLELTSQKGSH